MSTQFSIPAHSFSIRGCELNWQTIHYFKQSHHKVMLQKKKEEKKYFKITRYFVTQITESMVLKIPYCIDDDFVAPSRSCNASPAVIRNQTDICRVSFVFLFVSGFSLRTNFIHFIRCNVMFDFIEWYILG